MKTHAVENNEREAWLSSNSNFPHAGNPAQKLEFLVQFAILAPSSHNSQPWRFRIRGDTLELRADRSRACPVVDPNDRELIMSCGAALLHLRVAARHFGFEGLTETFPEPGNSDLLARFQLGPASAGYLHDAMLFQAIPSRRTNRLPFRDEAVPESVLSILQKAAQQEGAWLHFIRDPSKRASVASLVCEADVIQMSDPSFRRELAAWLHSTHGHRHDGMPGSVAGVNALLALSTPLTALAIRTFDVGEGKAARDREILAFSPVLAVIGTRNDVSEEWLAAGQALARVWLRARIEDVSLSFLNQPIEVPALRLRLSELIAEKGYPQLLLRLGYSGELPPGTPRRPVQDVLL
jgi:nitroreductase